MAAINGKKRRPLGRRGVRRRREPLKERTKVYLRYWSQQAMKGSGF